MASQSFVYELVTLTLRFHWHHFSCFRNKGKLRAPLIIYCFSFFGDSNWWFDGLFILNEVMHAPIIWIATMVRAENIEKVRNTLLSSREITLQEISDTLKIVANRCFSLFRM